ncbi:hypothetical protein ACHAPT_006011 [Fusarium lateritium]
MDLLKELEAMARATFPSAFAEVDDATVQRWQSLFGYTSTKALRQKELEGFDREAYEYSYTIAARKSRRKAIPTDEQTQKLLASTFLVKLEGPLVTIQHVAEAANMDSMPRRGPIDGVDSSGQPICLCEINGLDKLAIEAFLAKSNV